MAEDRKRYAMVQVIDVSENAQPTAVWEAIAAHNTLGGERLDVYLSDPFPVPVADNYCTEAIELSCSAAGVEQRVRLDRSALEDQDGGDCVG